MNHMLISIFESLAFVVALSTDALIASLAYGSSRIKIPILSLMEITFICTSILGISILFGSLLKSFIPVLLLKFISFLILLLLGITKLVDNIIKAIIDKHRIEKEFKFSLLNLNFILNIYANPKDADIDNSKIISTKEAFSLSIALSIDNLAAGVGAALGNINILAVIIFSIIISMISIKSGEYLGNKISNKMHFSLSWLSGVLLIVIAFFKL